MKVYRITLAEYAHELHASGRSARWNSNGTFVIYTASSRALACLENVVHRGGEGLNSAFRVMVISIPEEMIISEISLNDLGPNWKDFDQQYLTRKIGDDWVKTSKSCVLKVPSAIIPEECNYLINPVHKGFKHIQLDAVDPFIFDQRLMK